MKVLLLLEVIRSADILMQVVKLSAESWKLPEHVVLLVFVVRELVVIASLKDNATEVVTAFPVELSVGLIEETVGLVVSVVAVQTAPNFS